MLCTTDHALIYRGDRLRLRIAREAVTGCSFWKHPRLGGHSTTWIRIAYEEAGAEKAVFVQSREQQRLSHRPAYHQRMMKRLQSWWEEQSDVTPPSSVDAP